MKIGNALLLMAWILLSNKSSLSYTLRVTVTKPQLSDIDLESLQHEKEGHFKLDRHVSYMPYIVRNGMHKACHCLKAYL
eukprot:198237-Pelagomonas_calceolata.AAC.3